jgi:tellurite resistance protein TerC
VLFWGIMGALIMRGAMIGLGSVLIARFHWILYVFGAFLIVTGIRMLFIGGDEDETPKENPVVRFARRMFPITQRYHGEHFYVRAGSAKSHEAATPGAEVLKDEAVDAAKVGAIMLTPLALALVMVETTDLIFAVDSIPAIFAITGDPFIVFTSNVFAILGLRSLYFALAGMMDKFRYLKVSLAIILAMVGVKMLIAGWLKSIVGDNFNFWLLGVIGLILGAGVVASAMANRRDERKAAAAAANGNAAPSTENAPPDPVKSVG